MKKAVCIILTFVMALSLAACGSPGSSAPTQAAETKAPTVAATTEVPAPATEAPTTEASTAETYPDADSASSEDLDVAVLLIESVMKDSFKNYEVYHESGVIIINVWDDGIAAGAILAADGDEECVSAWNDLVENQKEFCLSVCDFVDTLGLDGTTVMINVLNDENKENTLLSIADGVVVYDYVNSQ